jgi:glutaredoxin 2
MIAKQPEKICPAFFKQKSIIRDIINKINNVDGLIEKARFAKELKKEVNVLLSCPDYFAKKTDCKNCHFIANLRKKTADLILKVKKLG